MLQRSKIVLNSDNSNNTAIIDSNGEAYTYGYLEMKIMQFTEALETIRPNMVMITPHSETLGVAAIMACIEANVNFAVHPFNEEKKFLKAKNMWLKTDIIISDEYVDDHILTLKEDGITSVPHTVQALLGGREEVEKYTRAINPIFWEEHGFKRRHVGTSTALAVNFHRGLSEGGLKWSGLKHSAILFGISHASELETERTVIFTEKFELLQDIVNGVLGPLSKGFTVKFANTESTEATLHTMVGSNNTIYSSADTLNKIFNLIQDNDSIIKYARRCYLGRLVPRLIAGRFRHLVGNFASIFITGRVNNFKVFNSLEAVNGIYTVYTMCEIASFIAVKKTKKFVDDYSVGEIHPDWVSIIRPRTSPYGVVMVYAPDMAVTTSARHFDESFVHSAAGRINTRDVGYIRDGELYLIGKDNFVFEDASGTRIHTSHAEKLVRSKAYVSDVRFVVQGGRLLMFIEPDIEQARKEELRLDDLIELGVKLEDEVNKKVFNGKPIVRSQLYVLPGGLDPQKFKILSRVQFNTED